MLAASAAATVVYLFLTAAALVSVVCPPLRALASHGKTRVSQNASGGEESTIRQLWHFVVHRLTLSKRRFADFYAVGSVATLAAVYATIASDPLASGRALLLRQHRRWLPALLLLGHLMRRYCECRWIQQSGTSSRMHLAGYLLGIVHYLCLPFVLAPPSLHRSECITESDADSESKGICNIDSDTDGVHYTTTDALIAVGCIYFQYQQHRHHVILANLRGKKSKSAYSLPAGGWFEYVSCPHYLSEIAIYVAFAILLNNLQDAAGNDDARAWMTQQSETVASWLGLSGKKCPDVATAIFNARHWVLLVWVATNLSISAHRTHLWYHENIVAYPQNRKRLIPFVW